MIQKQLTPVFLNIAMPSQYSLKCCVTNLRHDASNWDRGLVVHALDGAINLLPIGVFLASWVASKMLGVASFPLIF